MILRKIVAVLLGLVITGSPALSNPVADLQLVGSARLRVMFWTIYDSHLYTPSGQYDGIEPGLTLVIDYNRNIDADDLIERTEEEWRSLQLFDAENNDWLQQLTALWPDIRKGDSLAVKVTADESSQFFFNGDEIGHIASPGFTREFLAIWLSTDSSYPDARDRLVGAAD